MPWKAHSVWPDQQGSHYCGFVYYAVVSLVRLIEFLRVNQLCYDFIACNHRYTSLCPWLQSEYQLQLYVFTVNWMLKTYFSLDKGHPVLIDWTCSGPYCLLVHCLTHTIQKRVWLVNCYTPAPNLQSVYRFYASRIGSHSVDIPLRNGKYGTKYIAVV